MAITTVAGAISGMQYTREFVKAVTGTLVAGRPQSLLYLAGSPAAGVAPTPGLKGAALTSYGGQIPFTNPTSGNTYVARLQAAAPQGGTLLLCDRLWHNSGYTITSTGAQVIGCVYLYPPESEAHDISVQSWVRADRAALDAPLADAVASWIATDWPWQRPDRHGR